MRKKIVILDRKLGTEPSLSASFSHSIREGRFSFSERWTKFDLVSSINRNQSGFLIGSTNEQNKNKKNIYTRAARIEILIMSLRECPGRKAPRIMNSGCKRKLPGILRNLTVVKIFIEILWFANLEN